MVYLDQRIYTNGLNALSEGTVFHVCSAEPANFAGVAGVTLGNDVSPSIGAPANRTGGGRIVTIAAFTDGTVTTAGRATHGALVDVPNSRLLVAGLLTAPKDIVLGSPLRGTAMQIGFPSTAGITMNEIFDRGLSELDTNANIFHLCRAVPANYAAISTQSIGSKTAPTVTAPSARATGGGYEVTLSAFTDGATSATDDVTHWALANTTNTRLLCVGTVTTTAVASGNQFSIANTTVGMPGPTQL